MFSNKKKNFIIIMIIVFFVLSFFVIETVLALSCSQPTPIETNRACYNYIPGVVPATYEFCQDDLSDAVCWHTYQDCVYNGSVYNDHVAHNLSGGSEADAYCDSGSWMDCDALAVRCAACDNATNLSNCSGQDCYTEAAESGVGEYDSTGGGDQCCGDDANEYYNSSDGKCYTSSATAACAPCIGYNQSECGNHSECYWDNVGLGGGPGNKCVPDGEIYNGSTCTTATVCADPDNSNYPNDEIWVPGSDAYTKTTVVHGAQNYTDFCTYPVPSCDSMNEAGCYEPIPGSSVKYPQYPEPEVCCQDISSELICINGACVAVGEECTDPEVDSFSVDSNTSDFNTCDTSLTVTWSVSDEDEDLSRVEVWRKTDGGSWVMVHSESATGSSASGSWTDNVTAGHTYEYGIHVVNQCGSWGEEDSSITATIQTPPNAPSSLWFSSITKTSMHLHWTDNSDNETGFNIYKDEGFIKERTNSFWYTENDIVLECEQSYDWEVSAYNACGESSKTNSSQSTLDCDEDDPDDPIPPVIIGGIVGDEGNFTVNGNTTDFTTQDTSLEVAWTVTDEGGSGLDEIEVWRRDDGGAWAEVHSENANGSSDSGSWIDNVICDHFYEYGLHALDKDGNVGTELNTITATVECIGGGGENNDPVADFTFCKMPGTSIVQFTNLSTDPDGDDMDYYWDFDACGGYDLSGCPSGGSGDPNCLEDSTEEHPSHDYSIVYGNGETKVAGVQDIKNSSEAKSGKKTLDTIAEHSIWGKIGNWFKNTWQKIVNFFKTAFKKSEPVEEVKGLRTYNSKTYQNPDGTYTLEAHSGHINYQDEETGEIKPIDTTLIKEEDGWTMNKASYNLSIPKYANEWIEFNDMFEDKNQIIKLKPIAQSVIGKLVSDNKDEWNHKKVIYSNAFGSGIDLEIIASNTAFKKFIKINSKPKNLDQNLEFEFEIELPAGVLVRTSQGDWNKIDPLITNETIMVGDQQTGFSYLRRFNIWDSSNNVDFIKIELSQRNGKLYFKKILPKEFLDQAIYPVYTDATTSYYGGTGDGFVEKKETNWDRCRDATTGTNTTYTWNENVAQSRNTQAIDEYRIYRAFEPIDTSALPSCAEINSATMNIYVTGKYDQDNDSRAFIKLVRTYQSSMTSLSNSDYDNIYGSALSSEKDITSIPTGWNSWALNGNGRNTISKGGWSKFGFREGHDVDDHKIYYDKRSALYWASAESSNDPYLSINYIGGGAVLMAVDENGASNTHEEDINLDTMDLCESEYDLTNISNTGCALIGGEWDVSEGYIDASDYIIYRCEGDVGACDTSGDFISVTTNKSCGATNCIFEDSGVDENTAYSYYVSTTGGSGLNNSTLVPSCTGGTQPSGQVCPLADTTTICPVENLTITRQCGNLTLSWVKGDAIDYQVYRCIGNSTETCLNSTYFDANSSLIDISYSCGATTCSLSDNEIIPVNTINPLPGNFYCYKISLQNEEEEWSDLPGGAICNYSYCYRANDWQER